MAGRKKVAINLNHYAFCDSEAIEEAVRNVLVPALPGVHKVEIIAPGMKTIKKDSLSRVKSVFKIFLYCQVDDAKKNTQIAPAELWEIGAQLDPRGYGLSASDLANAIFDEMTGYVAAELVGNNLLVFFDLSSFYNEYDDDGEQLDIFTRLLEETAGKLKARKAGGRQKSPMRAKTQQQLYVAACANRKREATNSLRQSITLNEKMLEKTRQRLIQLIRETDICRAQLKAMEQGGASLETQYRQEYDSIMAMDKITNMLVDPKKNMLIVETKTLYCHSKRDAKTYEIGRFRITIDTTGQNEIRWFNLTRRVDAYSEGMQAPHIWESGGACYGTAETAFIEALAAHDYFTVIQLAIMFVESVNENDDAGQYIDRWPEAKPTKNKPKKKK